MEDEPVKVDASSWKIVNFKIRLYELIRGNELSGDFKAELGNYSVILPPEKRNPKTVEKLWRAIRPLLFRLMSRDRFRQSQYNKIVDSLIASHSSISAVDYKPAFKAIMTETGRGKDYYQIPDSLRTEKVDNFVKAEENEKKYITSWYYSFWYRRYVEGTMDISFEILKEIKNHYR